MPVSSVSVINLCRSHYFSQLDDLAFDMYQDPDVAQIIRKLERKKLDAVSSEQCCSVYLEKYEQNWNLVYRITVNKI